MFFRRSDWPARPSIALIDWRVMFSEARRTELMPCISASSRSVACLPMVSRKLTACASSALVSASRLVDDGGVDGRGGTHDRLIEQPQAFAEGFVQRARALDELIVERLGAVGERGVERARVFLEDRLQVLGAIAERSVELLQLIVEGDLHLLGAASRARCQGRRCSSRARSAAARCARRRRSRDCRRSWRARFPAW